MSKSIMYDLYCGNLSAWERKCVPNSDHDLLTRKIKDIKEHFKKTLPDEEYKKLQELEDLWTQADTIENADLFRYAFSMGVLLMNEVSDFKEHRMRKVL